MPALDLVTQIVETIYQLHPQQIEPLPPLLDWRGIYRIHDRRGHTWLLRLLAGAAAVPRAARPHNALPPMCRPAGWLGQPPAHVCRR